MTERDLILLREIVEAGGSKYIGGNMDRSRYERLAIFGLLTVRVLNASDVKYEVTDKGRQAAL